MAQIFEDFSQAAFVRHENDLSDFTYRCLATSNDTPANTPQYY